VSNIAHQARNLVDRSDAPNAGSPTSKLGTRDAETLLQDCGHDIVSVRDVDESLSLPRLPRQIAALFTDIYLKKAVLGGYELAARPSSSG
jgi:hypothetical protein